MEKISVIVPVFNVEKNLRRCVTSLVNQTYKNLEIILVNDGSTDNSGVLCEEYSKKYSNIIVIHKKNGGQSSARNMGLLKATGKYIGFVDSDDWIHPEMFSYLYMLIKKYDCDVADISAVFAKDFVELPREEEKINVYEGKKEILRNYMLSGISDSVGQFSVCRKLYKRELFNNNRFLEGRIYEDILINFEVLSQAKKLVRSNKKLYFYYQDDESTTRNYLNRKDFDLLYICKKLLNKCKEEGDEILIYYAKVKLARSYFSLLSKTAYYGISKELNKKEIVKELTKKLRKNYSLLIKSPIPISRKLIITAFCLNYNLVVFSFILLKKMKGS